MFKCEKCWESTCVCGYMYRNKSAEEMAKIIHDMLSYHDEEMVLRQLNKILDNEHESWVIEFNEEYNK